MVTNLKNFIRGVLLGIIVWLAIALALTATGCGKPKDGSSGSQGKPGISGNNGLNGQDGVSCTQVAINPSLVHGAPDEWGGSLITCANSSVLISNGSPGQDGVDGSDGAPGAPASSVVAVKFCPGDTVYPSAFPEYGFCVANKLYAVMWTNNMAWLAEITPGAYASTSGSVSCSFHVAANCVVNP